MTQINNIWNETRDITTDTTDIKDITKVHYKQLYTYKLDNWDEMDQFFEKYKLLQFIQYEIGNLSSPITIMENK